MAHLVALACSEPPAARECWTIQLLAHRQVELGIVEQIAADSVVQPYPRPAGRAAGPGSTLGLRVPAGMLRQSLHALSAIHGMADFARPLQELVDIHLPIAERTRIVLDSLNIHSLAVLYATFPPEKGQRITARLEFHHLPTHDSWLNMSEIEFSNLSRQCLG